MRIMVMGGSGFLGSEVIMQARKSGHQITATYSTRPGNTGGVEWKQSDLRNRTQALELIGSVGPDAIINTVSQPNHWAATADSAAHVAIAAARIGARLIFVSSDAVFADSNTPYTETATPNPTTAYGAAKAAAETAVKAICPDAVIARTSLIIGSSGDSSHERRVHSCAEGNGVLFTDDTRCPVHVTDLAAALLELTASRRSGVHHLAGPEPVSGFELGRLIAQRDGLDPALLRGGLRAEAPSSGPLNVQLNCTATQRDLCTRLRGVVSFLGRF